MNKIEKFNTFLNDFSILGYVVSNDGINKNIIPVPHNPADLSIHPEDIINKEYIEKIKVIEGTKTINTEAFKDCINLMDLQIKNGLITISRSAFNSCQKLKTVDLESAETLEYIGEFAFMNCKTLTEFKMPKTLRTLGGGAFNQCSELKKITIPEGVIAILKDTFSFCSKLEEITIPKSVKFIDNDAFFGDRSLLKIKYDGTINEFHEIRISNDAFLRVGEITIEATDGKFTESFSIFV